MYVVPTIIRDLCPNRNLQSSTKELKLGWTKLEEKKRTTTRI